MGVFNYLKHVDRVLEDDDADSNYFDILYKLTEMEFIKHKDTHVRLWVGICFQKLLARLRFKTDHCDKEKLQLILEFLIDNMNGVKSSNESLYKYSLLFVERLSAADTLCACSSLPAAAVTNISCILFYTAFQLINEDNWTSIYSSLLNILVRFAHQVLSLHDVTPVLDIIYVNIIKPSRKERPLVAKFTSELILACADILEIPTQEFLQSCLLGNISPKDSLVSEGKLDLIGQLHKICPWLVATVWGHLRNILKERDSPDRPQTLMLLAKMFCKSQSDYITRHYSTWRVFLDSLLIGSPTDNALVVQFAKEFLSVQQDKSLQKQFIELCLVPLVDRGDEKLVLDGMSAIVELLQTNTQLFTQNNDLLEILVTVARQGKEFQQREAAMSSLGQLFSHFYQHLDDNCAPGLDKKVMWIPATVLEQYKPTTGRERLAVEKVFLHHFIPIKLLTEERMERLLSIWLSLESRHYDIIRDMMVSSYCLRGHVRSLMTLIVSAPRDDPRIEVLQYEVLEVLDRSKSSPSRLMEEFVTILTKNQSLRTAMETVVHVETNTTNKLISVSANVICTLKIINKAVAQLVELIIFKILLFGIDVSSFTVLVRLVTEGIKEGGNISDHNPGQKELRLLYELLSWQPYLAFDESVATFFLELLTVGDTGHVTQTLKIISLLSKPPGKPLGEVYPGLTQERLIPLLQRLAIIGTPKQAKYSIRSLASHATERREHVFHPVLKDMDKVLSGHDEHYETCVTAVGHWAAHLPTDLRLQQSFNTAIDKFIYTNIVKELLYRKIVTSEEPPTCIWYRDREIPAHTRCMMAGIKTLANWICARKTPTNVKMILSLVWLIEDSEENWKDTNLGDADRARVRLSAGCALLKICEVPALWTCFSTALLSKLACLITDKVKQVRLGFARRLTRGLCREPGLPNDLLAFFPLSELSPDRQVCQQMREMLRKAIAAKRLRYRHLVLIEQVAVSTDQLINSHPHLLVEHSVGVAVFLLAFHPLFFAIDSWFDLYHVQCALEQLLEALITAAPLRMDDKFYKDLFTAIHSSRNTLVPQDEVANKKMWVACELGLSLLPNLQKGSGKVKTPEKFLLPVYFEPFSQTGWTDYIPTSLAKKLKSGKGGQRSATSSLEFSDLLEVQPPGDMRVEAEDEESEEMEEMEEMEEERNRMEVDEDEEEEENVITYHGSSDDSTIDDENETRNQ